MKGKKLSKALAFLLAVVMVFTTLPMVAFAEGEAETYCVTKASPAIPMNAMTQVKLSDLTFEIGDSIVNGANVEITLDDTTSDVAIGNGIIVAYNKGAYPATISYQGQTQTVYIVVKSLSDTEWVLFEETFGDYSAATVETPMPIPENWVSQAYASESHLDASIRYSWVQFENVRPYTNSNNNFTAPGVVPIGKYRDLPGGLSMYGAPAYFTLNDDVVKAFADYTISSDMIIYSNNYYCGHTESPVGAGLFGRAQVNTDGLMDVDNTDFSAIIVDPASKTVNGVARGWYVAHLKFTSKPNNSNVRAKKAVTFFKEGDEKIRWSYLSGKSNKQVSLSLKYEGTTATLSSSADTEGKTFTVSDIATNNGTVGVAVQQFDDSGPTTAVNVKNFKVVLNNAANECPVYSDIPTYEVSKTSPAIPMNAMTKVNMADLSFEIQDTTVNGKSVELTLIDNTDNVVISDGAIFAYKKGIYAAKVKYEDKETTVYIVVKNAEDKEWVLYEEAFGDYSSVTYESNTAFPAGWAAQAYLAKGVKDLSNNVLTDLQYSYFDFPYVSPYKTSYYDMTAVAPGINPIPSPRLHPDYQFKAYGMTGYMILNDSVVNAFADYTITSNMVVYGNGLYVTQETSAGGGLFGRAPVNANGKFEEELTSLTGFVVQPTLDHKNTDGTGLHVHHLTVTPKSGATNVSVSRTKLTNSASSTQWEYLRGKNKKAINLSVKFEGTKATLSSPSDAAGVNYVVNNVPQNNGAVGVATSYFDDGGQATVVLVKEFKVALNNAASECPIYSDIPIYNVDDNTPVIPMTAHSSTALSNIMLTFGNDAALANLAEWTSLDEQLVFENGKAIVYGAGTYTAKATYKDVTKTVYFVVKNADDAHYVVYGTDFDRDVGNDWTLYDNSFNVLDKTDVFNDTSNYEMFNGFTLAQNRYLMLDNEVIRNLRDYTMSVEFGYSGTMSDNSWGCLYLIGRADVMVPTADFNTAMLGFMPRLSSTPIRLFYKNDKFNTNFKDSAYIYTVGDLVEATVKLNDKQVIATIDGVEIYDTLKDSDYSATKRDRLPVAGGNVGLKASYTYAIKRYEVRLNAETVAGAPACAPLNNVLTNNTLYMTEGTRLAMSDVKLVFGNETVAGDKAKWSYVRNNVMEVSDFFDTVCAFTEGRENITATYNGQTINLTIVVEEMPSANTYPVLTSMIKTDGNGTAVITPVADDNYAYQIVVDAKDGYIVDTEVSSVFSYKKASKIVGRSEADATGNTLVADFDDLSDVVVNLAFKVDNTLDATMLGSSIRYANAETGLTNGIRFGMRSYNVKNKRVTNIKIDGTEYKVVAVGMVMLPKPLLEGELTVNTKSARYKEFTAVVDSTANYADFAMVLTSLPEEYLTLDIASRGFIKYEISEGNYGYYYADELQSSFDKIEKRIESAELKYDFYYSDFDKGYVTMVYDDYRGDLGTVFDIFEEKNVPLVAAIPPETVTSDSRAVLLRNIQAAGGEIIGHHFTVLTSAMNSEQKFNKLKTTYDVLTSYGLNVNGYMLAGGTGYTDINKKEVETMLRKIGFSYSDLYGISPNYNHERIGMKADNDASIYKRLDQAAANNTWISFVAHDLNTERNADQLRQLIDDIKANPNLEIVTYRYLYQNFGNFRNPVNWNNGVTQ